MDPDSCYQRFATAYDEQDWAECCGAAIELIGWINKGGFEPKEWGERLNMSGKALCKLLLFAINYGMSGQE